KRAATVSGETAMVPLIGWDCTRYTAAMGLDWLGAYDTWSFSFLCIHHIKAGKDTFAKAAVLKRSLLRCFIEGSVVAGWKRPLAAEKEPGKEESGTAVSIHCDLVFRSSWRRKERVLMPGDGTGSDRLSPTSLYGVFLKNKVNKTLTNICASDIDYLSQTMSPGIGRKKELQQPARCEIRVRAAACVAAQVIKETLLPSSVLFPVCCCNYKDLSRLFRVTR
ncbi:unnamed protein product, partial [Pleuronectes platessa]